MFTFITTASVRVAAQLIVGTSAQVVAAATDIEDVTVITCRDEEAVLVAAAFRHAGHWLDRSKPPRIPRGGTRRMDIIHTPIVASPVFVSASDHVHSVALTPEMECLERRARR